MNPFGAGVEAPEAAAPPVGPPAASGPPAEAFGPLLERMERLQSAFDAKIRYDEVRERLVESITQELAAHRQNQNQLQVRAILLDLISMHDDLVRIGGAAECASVVDYVQAAIEQTLARNGVEVFSLEGDVVDRTRQKVISVVEVSDRTADRTVARRLRPGFTWHGRVLRPEWVTAHRYAAPPAVEPVSPANLPHASEGVPCD